MKLLSSHLFLLSLAKTTSSMEVSLLVSSRYRLYNWPCSTSFLGQLIQSRGLWRSMSSSMGVPVRKDSHYCGPIAFGQNEVLALIRIAKVVTLEGIGQRTCEGGLESPKAIYAISFTFVPRPYAWGQYNKPDPETYFLPQNSGCWRTGT